MESTEDSGWTAYREKARKNRGWLLAVSLGLLLLLALMTSGGTESYLLLDNTTRLEYVEDNSPGSLYVESSSPLPTYYRAPEYEACIYTSENSSPLIVPVETQSSFFFAGQRIKDSDLMVSIPEENLSAEGINQELEVEGRERCPIRSNPKIVVREKN